MKKTYKILAIIATLILVVKYIPLQLGETLFKGFGSTSFTGNDLISIVFAVAMVIAFSYLARYFKSIAQSGIEKLIYVIIILQVIPVIMNFIPGLGEVFYVIVSSVTYLITFIFIILAGIKILRLKALNDKNIRLAKLFINSLLVVMLANLVLAVIVVALHKLEHAYIMTFLYTVPFLILAFMFWSMDLKKEPITAD